MTHTIFVSVKVKSADAQGCCNEVAALRSVVWKGIGFGLTSGVITTLGLIIGLHSGTHSRLAVLAGLIVLAVADAFSDAMGIHVSEEAEMEHSARELWETSSFTFLAKLFTSLTFFIPVAFLELSTMIVVSVSWGLLLITVFSFFMGRTQRQNPYKAIVEHIVIAVLVIVVAHFVGDVVYDMFGA